MNTLIHSLLIVAFTSMCSHAQQIKYADLATVGGRGVYTSYLASDGAEYKVGGKLKLGLPSGGNLFTFVTYGDGLLVPVTNVPAASSGAEFEILSVQVVGVKRSGYSVSIITKSPTFLNKYTVRIENALSTGEVKGFGMTNDEAMAKLKQAKDKLDLEIITREEYERIKAELLPFIK